MSRRPYFDPTIIADEMHASATHSNDGGYRAHCSSYEVVGMDGRNDWFRWDCRDCDRTYISKRSEKSQKYYKCKSCGALHFVYKGFFNIDRHETVPLKPAETNVDSLYAAQFDYVPSSFDQISWCYGTSQYIEDKQSDEHYALVGEIYPVDAIDSYRETNESENLL